MKCRRCLSHQRPLKLLDASMPLVLRWALEYVRCNTCLTFYVRVRLLGLLIPCQVPDLESEVRPDPALEGRRMPAMTSRLPPAPIELPTQPKRSSRPLLARFPKCD